MSVETLVKWEITTPVIKKVLLNEILYCTIIKKFYWNTLTPCPPRTCF